MNFGIIGFGKIARKFVKSIEYTTSGKVYAIGSKSLNKDDDYLKEHPSVIVYNDYEQLLEDKNIDAVYIALPHSMHKVWIIKSLKKKIPVLCEKPAVLTLSDMEEVRKVATKNNTYFLEALKTKFNKGIEQLKKDLVLIGAIEKLEANFCFDALPFKDSGSYLFDPLQGGALNDVGSYVIGFALDVIDSDVVEVKGVNTIVDGVERSFEANLSFENNAKAFLEGAIDKNKERYALITGSKGEIYIPMFNRIINYTIDLFNQEKIERCIPIYGDDMTLEIQALIDDVENNKIFNERHRLEDSCKIIDIVEQIRTIK